MGGSGGSIIIHSVRKLLSEPLVHGQLPADTKTAIDPILARDAHTWDATDRAALAAAVSWAICHIL